MNGTRSTFQKQLKLSKLQVCTSAHIARVVVAIAYVLFKILTLLFNKYVFDLIEFDDVKKRKCGGRFSLKANNLMLLTSFVFSSNAALEYFPCSLDLPLIFSLLSYEIRKSSYFNNCAKAIVGCYY